jgi:hypothetical protein
MIQTAAASIRDNKVTGSGHRPEELTGEIQEADLDLRALVGASGPVKLLAGIAQLLEDPAQREHLLSVLRLLESEPSIIGMSQNLIAVAQLPYGK